MMKKYSLNLLFLLVLGLMTGVQSLDLNAQTTDTISVNFGGDITNTFSNFTSLQPNLPDIGNYVENNLTDFSSDGTEEYIGDDVVTQLDENFFTVNITLTNVAIIGSDKDTLNAGDVFVQGHVNGNLTRYPEIGSELQLNNDENVDVSVQLTYTTAYVYNITIEVRESDPGSPDQSFGSITYTPTTMANDTLTLQTDTGEAELTFEVTLYVLNSDLTAKEILDGNRPYLYIDDETGETELPDDLVGRIIVGNDGGTNAMVLQYFFYWDTEYSPDGGIYSFELHKNDFEAFYVYYDLDNFGSPYRYVFNNYIYTELPGFPNENLVIIEQGATENSANYTTDLNEDLQLLLGVSTQQEAKILPLTALNDWEYNSLLNQRTNVQISSAMGSKTVQLTVDTSYHTFDLGPGGEEYGFDYNSTSELNDTRIKDWYSIIEDTFNNGTKVWSYFGIDVPEVGPFTFDITQVFTAPYVLSGYSSVSQDTTAIERARNSFLNVSQIMELSISYNFPSSLAVTYENEMSPGSTSIVTLAYTPSSNLEVSVNFYYELSANLSFWLVQASYEQVINNTITFDVDTAQVSSLADVLGLNEFEVEDQTLNSYLSLTGLTLYPTLFGTIIEGSLELDLWQVIETIIGPVHPLARVILDAIGYIINEFILSLDFTVSGVVTVPLSTSSSFATLNTTSITFSEDDLVHQVEITTSDNPSDFDLIVGDISYGINFQIEWIISLSFNSPVSAFVNGFDWPLGVFPDLTSNLIDSPGDSLPIAIATSPAPSNNEPSPFLLELGILSLLLLVPIRSKRR